MHAPTGATRLTSRSADRASRWAKPAPARTNRGLALAALGIAIVTILAAAAVGAFVANSLGRAGAGGVWWVVLPLLAAAATAPLLIPARAALAHSARAIKAKDIADARAGGAEAQTRAFVTYGYAAAAAIAMLAAVFVCANNDAVARTFFKLELIFGSFHLILSAFWTNVVIFMVAEVLVLVIGLLIAVCRMLPGPAGKPLRAIATVYTDIFRGLPAIITIYLVGFGLPLTGLPGTRGLPPTFFAVIALTLTYSAYVAEVYRAGIDSIHPSQTAAARSLGLSYFQTLRYVVVPQAIRRIIPPLLNDFISLQKDTALVNVIGAIDAFNQAKIVASNHFNLSSVTTVAIFFVVITIPQARLVDRLMEHDLRKMRAGG